MIKIYLLICFIELNYLKVFDLFKRARWPWPFFDRIQVSLRIRDLYKNIGKYFNLKGKIQIQKTKLAAGQE